MILTVLNEGRSISAFLSSISRLTSLPSEILIVDGGSTDATVEILRAWEPPPHVEVRVIQAAGANISKGRNIAIANARFEHIAATDAGTKLDPAWLRHLDDALVDGADVASGFFTASGTKTFESSLAAVITPTLDEIEPQTFLPSSRSIAFKRSAWRAAGGYPEWLDYCEDLVFDMSLQSQNARFVFVPNAIVTWDARPSMAAFAKQYFRYARGDGKAGLWRKRHLARYSAYIVGILLLSIAIRAPWVLAILGFGFAGYLYKFIDRVWKARAWLGRKTVPAFMLVPAIVVVGDVAKMAGYPFGLLWRHRTHQGEK